ncbi:hypothetical protein [Planctomycetes bacterium K23_9]|uniref:Uncharacterized protein n=1 Tax=Stieleria marina TaxID=1930275 RepID=A0A517NRW4_9BACT|nr:hypothetical protein K239x_18240 [Planctomycetes bacterium K23_9]
MLQRLLPVAPQQSTSFALAEETVVQSFKRQRRTDVYFSEAASAADVNGVCVADVVYGPYWFAGPDFKTKQEICKPIPRNRDRYADNFFIGCVT